MNKELGKKDCKGKEEERERIRKERMKGKEERVLSERGAIDSIRKEERGRRKYYNEGREREKG